MSLTPEAHHNLENGIWAAWFVATACCLFVLFLRVRKHRSLTMGEVLNFRLRASAVIFGIVLLALAADKALQWISVRDVAPRAVPISGTVGKNSRTSAGREMRPGKQMWIVCGGCSTCVVAVSARDEPDVERAAAAGRAELTRMEAEGRAYEIKSGTEAVFLGSSRGGSGADVSEVYCGIGPHSGMLGWVPSRWLRKQSSAPSGAPR